MATTKVAKTVAGFTVMPLRFPAQPSYPVETTHYLYVRANAPRVPTEDTPRELFLANIPIDATLTNIRALFAEQLGGARVEDVEFADVRIGRGIRAPIVAPDGRKSKKRKRTAGSMTEEYGNEVGLLPDVWDRDIHHSGGTAVVRFVDQASAELALKEVRRAVRDDRQITWRAADTEPKLGSMRYLAHHRLRYPDPTELQASVDAYMAAFAQREAARSRELARLRSEPDEDGFVTVTRGGRTGPAREEAAKAREEVLRQRKKDRVKDDFYRFQVRERMKSQAQDLVKGFEEDRRKLEQMRRARGKIRPE